MIKGISKQVIVVHAPDPHLFEEAIFILKEGVSGVTNDALLKEARELINAPDKKRHLKYYGPVWACGGAVVTGFCWLLSVLI